MKRPCVLILLLLTWISVFAQVKHHSGIILDEANGQPIPRASVGVAGKDAGAYANDDGNFSLANLLATDTLIFSALGYQTRRLSVAGRSDTIHLRAVSYELPTADFTAAGEREHVMSLGFQKRKIRNGLIPVPGSQYVRYMANPFGEQGLLVAATFQLSRGIPGQHSGGVFRIRVLARKPDSNTLYPGKDLLLKTVEFATPRRGGFINIPLREHGIAFPSEGLFVGLEYLAPAGKIPIREDGAKPGPSLGLYTTTKGRALTFSLNKDQLWITDFLPPWRENEVPNMAFGAVVVFRR